MGLCDTPLAWTDVTVYAITAFFFAFVISGIFDLIRRK